MRVEICAVGGYNEVGRNMTAVKVGDDVIVCDLGLHMERYIRHTDEEDVLKVSAHSLASVGAIPDISSIKDWAGNVRAIIPTHAHLDHVGAIPYLAGRFDAPVLATPFSIEVIRAILRNEEIELCNSLLALNPNSTYHISKDVSVEFVQMTHSTPQTVMVVIHTPDGAVIYANDFKFDNYPVLGKPPNLERLRQIGKEGVLALVVDSLYAHDARKMPSESVAKEMLRDVLLGTESRDKAIIVTTFSSHIARLKSIVEFGEKLGRKIIFLGRSLDRYVTAAEKCGIANFRKSVDVVRFGGQIRRKLAKVMKEGKRKYLLVVTGHQAEPKATLSKMIDQKLGFVFDSEDHVVFASGVIPTQINRKYRAELEKKLRGYGVRIFADIHVSGHAAREDLRDLLNMLKPRHLIPAHAMPERIEAFAQLAREMGYHSKQIHQMKNGQRVVLE